MAGSPEPPLDTGRSGRAAGFNDWLAGSAARRRALTESMVGTFESWGYGFIATPLVEPLDTIAAGMGGANQARLFRFMDADGTLLALVGERTVSVARVVATQLQQGPFPLRLCYAGPVLHNRALMGGRRRESVQVGCELIGATGLAADAECVALAAAALERGGLSNVQVDVGHAGFIPGLLESAGLEPAVQRDVLAAFARRDLVAVESALERTDAADAERRLLLAFPTLRGGRDILDTAALGLRAERPRTALQELAQLWDMLDAHGISDRVHLDLGAVRDWDYYTGPTFEVFSIDSGFPLGSGGRYDSLLARFGAPLPATGFMLHVDRCHDSITRRGLVGALPEPMRLTWDGDAHAQALAAARSIRERGTPCVCDLEPTTARADGAGIHVSAHGAEWSVNGTTAEGPLQAGIDALTGAIP